MMMTSSPGWQSTRKVTAIAAIAAFVMVTSSGSNGTPR